ncbi:MAG TPA: hypothetical protein PKY88_04500 [Anaerohalosphaeraceae bacterium]|nr:hypothetical protein [Anaerohalosphaeraceae bacterium]
MAFIKEIRPILSIESEQLDQTAQPLWMRFWITAVVLVGLAVFGIYSATHMVAAGDTWVALACGRHFAEHGVDTVEPFSFNSHPAGPTAEDIQKWPRWAQILCKPFSLETIQKWHPTGWINQNWLTHLLFYKLVTFSAPPDTYEYNRLVYWKFALYILTAFAVYGVSRVLGVGPALSLLAACFGLVVGRTFFDIRPAGFSNFLTPVFFLILALSVYRNIHFIWLLVPLVVFWANVHGGYIYVSVMLVPFLGIHLLGALPKKWSFALGLIGLWWVLYLLSHQFLTHEDYALIAGVNRLTPQTPSFFRNGYVVFLFILSLLGIGTLFLPPSFKGAFYLFFTIGTLAVFFILFLRMQIQIPYDRIAPAYHERFRFFIQSSQGRYGFVFLTGILFVWLTAWKKNLLVLLPAAQIAETAAAAAVSFLAMLLLNPFRLTNLTHTFEISISKHAESWRQVNEWRPAFDWLDKTRTTPNPVGEEEAFAVLCILTAIVFLIWLAVYFFRPRQPSVSKTQSKSSRMPEPVEILKIDLALWTLAALTLYMAVQSRRFIAVAGSGVCPFVAHLLSQIGRKIGALSKEKNLWTVLKQPKIQTAGWAALTFILIGLMLYWGLLYKRIYLDPWPNDPVRNSLFMRMTASNVKPFEVCDFINGNHLQGRMFNYWTEGGALAFGQNPDEKTGRIPLQLFMDGRAQAAYNHDKYEYWQLIFSGGPEAVKSGGQKLNYASIGEWISRELRKNNVWIISMPTHQASTVFMQAILRSPDWKIVYLDTCQQLVADLQTPQGKELAEAILAQKAFFPDELSRHLSTAMLILETQNASFLTQMTEHAAQAFRMRPCASSYMVLQNAMQWPPFREQGRQIIKDFFEDICRRRDELKNQSGSAELLTVAGFAADYLAKSEPEQRNRYRQFQQEFRLEADRLMRQAVW